METVQNEYEIVFQTTTNNVLPVKEHLLSINGPYIDGHFGLINKHNPVGQTYYLRPLTKYYENKKVLSINVSCSNYSILFNKNQVTTDVKYCGSITLTDVTYLAHQKKYKIGPNSMIDVNLTVHNATGSPLRGLHIHDGINKDGLTNFGPICYFLYNTYYWMDKKKKGGNPGPTPLPAENVVARTNYVLQQSAHLN